MIIIRVSSNRILFVNNLWFAVPIVVLIDIILVILIRQHIHKEKMKIEREQLEIKHQKNLNNLKKKRIFRFAVKHMLKMLILRGADGLVANIVRDVTDYVEVINDECELPEGINYIDDYRLRMIIKFFYKFKRREDNKIIFVTKSALCYLARQYSLNLWFVVFPIPDIFRVTDWFFFGQTIALVAGIGLQIPVYCILAASPYFSPWFLYMVKFISGILLAVSGTTGYSMFSSRYHIKFKINSTPIDSQIASSDIRPRFPHSDVVSLCIESSPNNKIRMKSQFEQNSECSLFHLGWNKQKCSLRVDDIPAITSSPYVDYDDVVNLEDVTRLQLLPFNDQLEVGQKPITKRQRKRRKLPRFKPVTFSERIQNADESTDYSDINDLSDDEDLSFAPTSRELIKIWIGL